MTHFIVHNVTPDVTVRVIRKMPPLPPAIDAEVERLWRQASARVAAGGAGTLFNGQVFSIDAITPHAITGHLTEYRRLVAQMEDHGLFPALGIRSLSVCGVLRSAGGIAIGRRPAAAIYQPGMWQMAPAGSVDAGAIVTSGTADLAAQVLRELEEELGITATHVTRVAPICIVEHPGSHVSDCGMALTTSLDADAVQTAHRQHGNGEYSELRLVPEPALPAFIAWAGDTLVPPAREFLFRLGLLDQGLSPPTGP